MIGRKRQLLRKWLQTKLHRGCLRVNCHHNGTVTIWIRKFMTNRLLQRKQMVTNVLHPRKATIPKTEIREKLAKIADDQTRCHLCIWIQKPFWWWRDNWLCHNLWFLGLCKENEPKYRLARHGLEKKKTSKKKTLKGMQ
ncbi:40S ribosomal protein S24 [Pteropus alecto]|uniref:Small ribosomal subunit protein eS24 n=1 Tax=Pteropus alecto TaxID=9402 RepID=L5KJJ7_PTEAL|nr:40S ribosomal protein S24 [Pteropus alecto]